MMKLFQSIGLRKEALLFDGRLYIIKAIFAIATGYIIGKAMPIAHIDMISVLLGVMYNLEPINILGIKGGIQQLIASVLGAACTSVLIILFGINIFTIAVSMALTLFVSLKINWRMVSPVAIFTCIYMTQFVQLDVYGNPSIWLTFRLRIVALGLGVLIAILYNFIFSFLYYRRIAHKRLQYAKIQLVKGLEYTEKQLTNENENKGREYITLFPSIFNDLDLVYSNVESMLNESKYSINLLQPERLQSVERILRYFRDINHLAYDINFEITRDFEYRKLDESSIEQMSESIKILKNMDFMSHEIQIPEVGSGDIICSFKDSGRISSNIGLIHKYATLIIEEVKKDTFNYKP